MRTDDERGRIKNGIIIRRRKMEEEGQRGAKSGSETEKKTEKRGKK